MGITTEDTVSTATRASYIFNMQDDSENRRRLRSPEPGRAVSFQFERVYDMVGSEAIVLCDARGRQLRSVGERQLCRMLSVSTPAIYRGDAQREVQLKGMELLRPNTDWSSIAIRPIRLPVRRKQLFVASVSDSTFNQAGVHHAREGIRRILGIPQALSHYHRPVVSSRDRLAYDVSKALTGGYHDFNGSTHSMELRVPGRFRPRRSRYVQALSMMLWRVDRRLEREGLYVERPKFWNRHFGRSSVPMEGYRALNFALPVRRGSTGRRLGTMAIEMTCYDRAFNVPQPPNGVLTLDHY